MPPGSAWPGLLLSLGHHLVVINDGPTMSNQALAVAQLLIRFRTRLPAADLCGALAKAAAETTRIQAMDAREYTARAVIADRINLIDALCRNTQPTLTNGELAALNDALLLARHGH